MAQVRNDGEDDPNNTVVTSQSLTAETTTGAITSPRPPLLNLHLDLLSEILCRLPVILLLQLRCVCKSFNSLISDKKFAKKHLHMSYKRQRLMLSSEINTSRDDLSALHHSPISSVFATSTVVKQTRLFPPISITDGHNYFYANVICSCDGIFCGIIKDASYFLWNPSIKKFKLLSPLKIPRKTASFSIGFGYDHSIDNYKVVAVSEKNEVFINSLGTDCWTRIEDIPYDYYIHTRSGIFVSGTLNWFAMDDDSSVHFILSLDLAKESYQMLLLPDFENEIVRWNLGVLSDCLCVFAFSDMFMDVWIMKQYGDQESWTKYTIPNMQELSLEAYDVLYFSEDNQMLLQCYEMGSGNTKLVVYDFQTRTLNIPEFENDYGLMNPKVYLETLISP